MCVGPSRSQVHIVPNTSLMPDSGNILQHALPSFHTACTHPYLHTACRSHPFTPNALPIPSQRMPCQLEKMMQKWHMSKTLAVYT